MLSLGKLAPGQQQYYLDTVARGAEEYYTGAKEAPGSWVGSAAGTLGLTGEVDAAALGHVLEHVDPTGTYRLTAAHSAPRVAGFDVTFCAPKSVSLLFALGAPEVSNEVRNAADASVAASLEVLERAACRVRRGKGGHTVLDGDGLVAAAFRHRTSRAGDPHLHTHVVIANLGHQPDDGRWTALDGRPLYSWLAPVGHLYEAHLRWELTQRLGVAWGPVSNGIADISGVDRTVIREFSTRRREIEAHLDEHGFHSAKAAQFATYATRAAKDPTAEVDDLLPAWRRRAAALGLDDDALTQLLGQVRTVEPPRPGSVEADVLYERLASPEGLTAKASTFGEREVIKAICNALPGGGRVDDLLDLVEGFLTSEHVLALVPSEDGATIRRNDGVVIPARTDEMRFTTPEMVEVEHRVIDSAARRQHRVVVVASQAAVSMALDRRPTMSDEQATMVRTICRSGHGVDIVEGVAGAGKTYALAAAADAWRADGQHVIGCALAARAAKQLDDEAGIPSSTIDRLLGRIERHETALDDSTVLVIDEAAMVGTRTIARLLDHAEHSGAKVVLVGDPCQLPEIDAGGAFRGLRSRLGVVTLSENRRQVEPWEREVLADVRAGDVDYVLDTYREHGRLHEAPTSAGVRDQLVADWMAAWLDVDQVVMLAARHADVRDLNARARATLQDAGYLGPDRAVIGGHGFTEGDEVLALRNDYRLGLLNGTRGVIERIDTTRHALTLGTDHGAQVTVPFDYIDAGHLTHGYASTIHKAQGLTVDRCLVLLDDTTTREQAYTALSRGRLANEVYVVADESRVEDRHATEVDLAPLERLIAGLGRRGAKTMAIDHDRGEPELDRLRRERDRLRRQIGTGPADPSWEHRRLVQERERQENNRRGAEWRRGIAEENLRKLGPVGRRLHRTERLELERRIERFEAEMVTTSDRIADLNADLDALAPAMELRTRWEREHSPALRRLDGLNDRVQIEEQLERLTRPRLEQGIEYGLGIEL